MVFGLKSKAKRSYMECGDKALASTPVIINERGKRSVISTESCFRLCFLENGEDVKLSWYRENERISITNNTDLSVPLNLPLQIQHNDTNTYICVSANPVSNKTTSLIITQLCDVSDKSDDSPSLLPVLISAGVFLLLILTGFVWVWLKRKNNKLLKKLEEVAFTEVTITAHSAERVKKVNIQIKLFK
ncbi:signaling lymphocytic activation molecule-like [Tachysurus fulvidraco]|uniref:signaling lymphocytic activation molecule-like n=1 Tax=Tachysurus fulvidraco TaxID=1234273 RepID=UPI001FEF5565|nr:signaling lymphocytic activation molecule-like [Tachysurus fulvidraco]